MGDLCGGRGNWDGCVGLWGCWTSELWEGGSDGVAMLGLDSEVWEHIGGVADVGGDQVVEDVLEGVGGDGEGQLGFNVRFEEGTSCGVVGLGQLLSVLV